MLAHAVVGDARPHRDAEPDELEDALGALPLPEVGELVAADDEDGVLGRPRLERVHGACVRIELDFYSRQMVEREPSQLEARLGRSGRLLVPGVGDDEDEEPLEAELRDRCARKGHVTDVRRIEGAAEDAYCHSSASPSSSTSAPRLTPARRSASSSSSAGGGVPTTR